MLGNIWHLDLSVGEKILRPITIYVFLLLALRLGGRREIGQLKTMDILVLLLVANAVQNGIIGNDNSISGAFIGAITLFVINGLASTASGRSQLLRRLLIGTPIIVIENGVTIQRNVKHLRMSNDDLTQALAEQGVFDLSQVASGIMEPNGHFAITLTDDKKLRSQIAALTESIQDLTIQISELKNR